MQRKEPKYEDGIEYWQCPTCRQWLSRDHYYKDTRTGNGLKSQCRKCHTTTTIKSRDPNNARRINREYMQRARGKDIEKFRERERNRPPAPQEKVLARNLLNHAVKNGEVNKPKQCPKCGSKIRINGHHSDYTKPLEVEWMCPLCHAEHHRLGMGNFP